MFETVRYSYRLRPGANAERTLIAEWHRCRFLWNEAVHQQKSGNKPTLATPARLARPARKPVLHLPTHWPWKSQWMALWRAVFGDSHVPPQVV